MAESDVPRKKRTILSYGVILALGAFVLHWLEIQYAVRLFSTELYIVVLALLFTAVGINQPFG